MSDSPRWRAVGTAGSLLKAMSDKIVELEPQMPDLVPDISRVTDIMIASDYSGQHAGVAHKVYSLLLVDRDHAVPWDAARMDLRRKRDLGTRRFSYKDLRDAVRWNSLPEFLDAADKINGVLLTVLVHCDVKAFFLPDVKASLLQKLPFPDDPPTERVFEEMIRVAHFLAFLVCGLMRDGQNLEWVTDSDPIVANATRQNQMGALVTRVCNAHDPPRLPSQRAWLTRSDDSSLTLEDTAAIPDLAAGALAAVLGEYPPSLRDMEKGKIMPPPEKLEPKTRRILNWLVWKNRPLRRWTFLIESSGERGAICNLIRLYGGDDPFPESAG